MNNPVRLRLMLLLSIMTVILPATICNAGNNSANDVLKISTFDVDATPPVGTNLAYQPMINKWDLGLRARGVVLQGSGLPIVLCSVDWICINNDSHDAFREALAEAAGTVPDRVAVHTVHQHDAPMSDFGAEKYLKDAGMDPMAYDGTFQREVIRRLEVAIRSALENPKTVTHIGLGQAEVYKVASNRRILGPDGKVRASRSSSCRDSALQAEPEGLIDPMVSLISFWNEEQPVAVLSYYATHPQSYYLTGVANPDFPGIARFYRQLAVPEALHVHFNGAGGNIAAGKYNDGSKERRGILAERVADGMKRAWESTIKQPATAQDVDWQIDQVSLPPASFIQDLEKEIKKGEYRYVTNNLFKVVWLNRIKEGKKLNVNCLSIGNARILFMPGELCIEYQLAAKQMRPDLFVAMAAYGDCGTGYICTAKAYEEGGYEAGPASAVTPESEAILMKSMHKLLQKNNQKVN
ncbi:MAG: hypothetical protein PHH93_08040 [Prolixibacteraceae bacterium]|nr:hypothetical protein [Prolixibacteraceae bacterium]